MSVEHNKVNSKSKTPAMIGMLIGSIIASPVLLMVLIAALIKFVIVTSLRHSVFNEFGRRIIYMNSGINTKLMLKLIANSLNYDARKDLFLNAMTKRHVISDFPVNDLPNNYNPDLKNKAELYRYLRLFLKVGVFNYNESKHAQLHRIPLNTTDLETHYKAEDFYMTIKEQNDIEQLIFIRKTDNSVVSTHFISPAWLLLVDKKPEEEENFNSIGILTGSGFFQLVHTEAEELFKAYGVDSVDLDSNETDLMYNAKRVLSRARRGLQAKLLRQQVPLSRTRARTRERRRQEILQGTIQKQS